MNKIILSLLLIFVITIFSYSYLNIPKEFETAGGSCYKGITAMFIKFFLKIYLILNLVAIIFAYFNFKIKTAKICTILSLVIWFTGFIIHANDNFTFGLIYFTPLLIVNSLIVFQINKSKIS